jgi:hypothetical protein
MGSLNGSLRLALAVAVAFALSTCGGGTEQAEPTTPEPAEAEPAAEATPEAAAGGWEGMGFEQRAALMREEVTPEMGRLFGAFDAARYSSFACANCHGQNFQEVNFRMPNGLAPLHPAEIPTMAESADAEDARFARFMFGEVVPGMVRILGVQPYDMETHQGFGCMNCHAMAE